MDKELLKKELFNKGYCVIPNILSDQECNETIDKIWQWLSSLGTGINRNDPLTWKAKYWPPSKHGIIHQLAVGQEEFAWNVRSNPKVIKIFQEIWNTQELLTSFDSVGIGKPPELLGQNKVVEKLWFHIDQSSNLNEHYCVQSFINLEETTEVDSCFCCLPGSNLYFEEFIDKFGLEHEENWYQLSQENLDWFYQKGIKPIKVSAPKGSIVLWDSRTIHCNRVPMVPRKNPTFRYTIYVCMTPKKWASDDTIKKRIKAYQENRMSTHIPHQFRLYPKDNYLGEEHGINKKELIFTERDKPCQLPVDRKDICRKLIGY